MSLSVCLEGQAKKALLDTGSSFTLVRAGAIDGCRLDRDERVLLETKEAELLGQAAGIRVLGLRVDKQLSWSRDNSLVEPPFEKLTRRALHS